MRERSLTLSVRRGSAEAMCSSVPSKAFSDTHGYESTKQGVHDSLAKMKFDYIDLFLIHDPLSGKERRLEAYRALLEAKKAGKIRSVGVSNYHIKHIEEIKEAGYEMPSVNQIEEIVNYCKVNNIVIEAYCPIIRGKMDHPVIKEVAAKYNRDPAQVLCRWSLQKEFVPLPRSWTPSRIHSNANLYDFELAEEDVKKLDDLDLGKAGSISWNPVDAA
ncbi:2,5-didehydrogluconate reductase [Flammula alnicola]|nr:2,5-didehydrogluconate reductase [Flammula alnicola]